MFLIYNEYRPDRESEPPSASWDSREDFFEACEEAKRAAHNSAMIIRVADQWGERIVDFRPNGTSVFLR